jgi:hypothetical protein
MAKKRCMIPIGWLGPSGRKKYRVRKGSTITVAKTFGGCPAPDRGRGSRAKITHRLNESVLADIDGVECQVTHIVVPCEPGMTAFAGRKRR